jgi:hypothetical protein
MRRLTPQERGLIVRGLLRWADELDSYTAPPSVTRDAIRVHAKLARSLAAAIESAKFVCIQEGE